MFRKKLSSKVLVADQSIFKILLVEEPARIVLTDGEFGLFRISNKRLYNVPPGIALDASHINKMCNVLFRPLDDVAVLTRGKDEVTENDVSTNDSVMFVDNVEDLVDIQNEVKVRALGSITNIASAIVSGLAMTASCLWLDASGFLFPKVAQIGAVFGAFVFLMLGLMPAISFIRVLVSNKVYDSVGNFVNLKTGETSLNGGMYLPINKGV